MTDFLTLRTSVKIMFTTVYFILTIKIFIARIRSQIQPSSGIQKTFMGKPETTLMFYFDFFEVFHCISKLL